MKTFRITLAILLGSVCLAQAGTNVTALLQRGLFEEEANHNIEAAIAAYQSAIAEHDKDRKLAATAVFRLGECLRKQGKPQEAAAYYQRVLREFSDQETLAKYAAQALGGDTKVLAATAPAPVTPVSARLEMLYKAKADVDRKLIDARAYDDRLRRMTNPEDFYRFFSTTRQDEELIVRWKRMKTSEIVLASNTNDPNNQQRFKSAQESVFARIDALRWAAGEEVGTLASQVDTLQKDIDEELKKSPQTVVVQTAQPAATAEAVITDEEEKEIRRIKVLIQNSPDLINAGDTTPLQNAAANGYLKVAEFLLANGATVEATGKADFAPPLYIAASKGQKSMVELLLSKGASPEGDRGGDSPLSVACENGFKSVAEVLIAHKANVNEAGANGKRALHLAARKDNAAMVEILLAAGADVEAKDNEGYTPLIHAASSDKTQAVSALLAHKANPNAASASNKVTALHFAARFGDIEMAKALLAAGAQVDAQIDPSVVQRSRPGGVDDPAAFGPTPLTWAISKGQAKMVQWLLDNRADPNIVFAFRNPRSIFSGGGPAVNDMTPLVLALQSANAAIPIVEALLSHGADPNKPVSGSSPLFSASAEEMAKALIAHKADVNATNSQFTVLTSATARRSVPIAKVLCESGADINAIAPEGWTALIHAIYIDDTNMLAMLLEHKADPNALDRSGVPPLAAVNSRNDGWALAQIPPGNGVPPLAAVNSRNDGRIKETMRALLLAAGANPEYMRLSQIAIQAQNDTEAIAVLRKGAQTNCPFTLMDALAEAYAPVSQGPGHNRYLGVEFPDFQRVMIHRLLADEKLQTIPVDAQTILNSGDKTKDVPLAWGDVIVIPVLDHPVGEQWSPGKFEFGSLHEKLADLVSRKVEVTVKGQRQSVVLGPSFLNAVPAINELMKAWRNRMIYKLRGGVIVTNDTGFSVSYPPGGSNLVVIDCWLSDVVRHGDIRRASSDISRVKVTRKNADGTVQQWVVNEEKPPGLNDIWLKEGDQIEIPELDINSVPPVSDNAAPARIPAPLPSRIRAPAGVIQQPSR